ncbi:MAG: MFS transporter [Deltaproteobacteria bacterium]|nr:MFS transporter [Deltaproteobacteria bacterium]
MEKIKTKLKAPALWVWILYTAEGLPFTFLRTAVVPAFLKEMGASLQTIGYTSLLGIPYTFKFLWSPLIDLFWKRRHWTLALQFSLVAMLVFLSFIVIIPNGMTYWWIGFAICAFLSATQDIAIDGFYLEALDEKQQSAYAGLRIASYRVSMILGTSIPLMIAGKFNWFAGFMSCAALLGVVFAYNFFFLPPSPEKNETTETLSTEEKMKEYFKNYLKAFQSYLAQDRIFVILIFMLLYKLGDAMLFSMNTPFLLDLGITKFQLGWLSGTIGKICSIAGSIAGGWWAAKRGLKKGLIELALTMNIAILAYVWLALVKPGLWGVAFVHALEQFAAGVGTTAFVIFQMRTCNPEFRASHYAIATSFMAFGPMISGPIGGYLASHFGYASFFTVCFLASIPGFLLIFLLPKSILEKR